MKKFFAIFALALFVFQGAHAQETMSLPSTMVKDAKGSSVPFNKTVEPGKITLVSFWATWCVPCKKEIRAIRDNLKSWQADVDFNYMTVSLDDSRATAMARSYAKTQGWTWPFYQDPNSDLKRSLNFQNIPFSIIIDQNGKVAYMHTGYSEGNELELFAKIKELAGK